jgi:hypothetical protein
MSKRKKFKLIKTDSTITIEDVDIKVKSIVEKSIEMIKRAYIAQKKLKKEKTYE